MSDAREEAERRYPYRDWHGFSEVLAVDDRRDAFIAGAAWQASRPVTDEQIEAAAEAIIGTCFGQELPEAPIDLARAALEAAREVQG